MVVITVAVVASVVKLLSNFLLENLSGFMYHFSLIEERNQQTCNYELFNKHIHSSFID